MNDIIDLSSTRLVVVGADSGIGLACSRMATEAGARVIGTTVKPPPTGGNMIGCDVGSAASVARAIGDADALLGGIDAVIFSAGVYLHHAIADTTEEDWQRVLNVNLDGAFRVAKAVEPLFRTAGSGSLVLISSQIGVVGHRSATAYAASKAGLNGLMRALAVEFATFGARVNGLGPGPVETPMTAVARADPDRVAAFEAAIPLGRLGRADEIARPALFLASAAASFITGHLLLADGGWTAV